MERLRTAVSLMPRLSYVRNCILPSSNFCILLPHHLYIFSHLHFIPGSSIPPACKFYAAEAGGLTSGLSFGVTHWITIFAILALALLAYPSSCLPDPSMSVMSGKMAYLVGSLGSLELINADLDIQLERWSSVPVVPAQSAAPKYEP